MTPKLLVSVRSAAEAEEALAGGADLIDVKEPNLGSLGRASDAIVAEIVKRVAGRVPTSAALGELADWDGTLPSGVDFVKAGLAGLGGGDWRERLVALQNAANGRAVIVSYADWQIADAPPHEDVVAYAATIPSSVLLIDTYRKMEATLLDFIDDVTLSDIRRRIHRVAFAGSLDRRAATRVAALGPDWIAVRGAVCEGGRTGIVQRDRIRDLQRRLARPSASCLSK